MPTKVKLIDLFNITIADFLCQKRIAVVYYEKDSHVGTTISISPRLNKCITDYSKDNGIMKTYIILQLISEVEDNQIIPQ